MSEETGHNFLRGIDPEKLIAIDIEDIFPLLNMQYAELFQRSRELAEAADKWLLIHTVGPDVVIHNDADMTAASERYAQLRDHAGNATSKESELEAARKKVRLLPYRAVRAIDAAFNFHRDIILGHMETIDKAQKTFVNKKIMFERKRLAEEAAAAQAEAARLAREARRQDATEAMVDRAIDAAHEVEVRNAAAVVPATELVRTRSAMGITTSAAGKWVYEVSDIKALCQGVIDGTVPESFIQTRDTVVNATIRAERGSCAYPGLTIRQEYGVRRTGA